MSVQATSNLPFANELMLQVFSYLKIQDLGRSAKTCKEWRTLAYDETLWKAIMRHIPLLTVIDGTVWKNFVYLEYFGLDVEDPELNEGERPHSQRAVVKAIKEMIPLVSETRHGAGDNAGVTLLTIPKGLTYNKLKEIARMPILVPQNERQIPYVGSNSYSEEFGDLPVDKTYRVVISNSILNGTFALDHVEQNTLLEGHGFDTPEALQVATLAILKYRITAEKMVYSSINKFTRCQENDLGVAYMDRRMSAGWNGGYLFVGHKKDTLGESFGGVGAVKKF